jgi:D-alanyl-D-alanine carboxypeptidase
MITRALLCAAAILTPLAVAEAAPAGTFNASIEPLTPAAKEKMDGVSWKDGCPAPLADLVAIHLTYLGFDKAVHDGVLVVHRRVAEEVVTVFGELFQAGFPIERMQPYEDFAIGKYADSNDTVGFYCRPAQDNPSIFSWHAYGIAVDINPKTNPYHDPKEGWWPAGSDGNRDRTAQGLLTAQSEVVKIFMRHGWAWGGMENPPDYMHFAKLMVGDDDNPLKRPIWARELEYAPD